MVDIAISSEIEKYVAKVVESRLQQAIEDFSKRNEIRIKELSLIERVVRVEEELRSLRETFEVKFDAWERRFESLQKEINARFEVVDKRFEVVDKRFEAMDKRFEAMDKRFEALQREMNARFEAMDKRFSVIQWMIGIFVGVPALIIAVIEVLGALK